MACLKDQRLFCFALRMKTRAEGRLGLETHANVISQEKQREWGKSREALLSLDLLVWYRDLRQFSVHRYFCRNEVLLVFSSEACGEAERRRARGWWPELDSPRDPISRRQHLPGVLLHGSSAYRENLPCAEHHQSTQSGGSPLTWGHRHLYLC